MSAAPATTNGSLVLADAGHVLKLLESSLHADGSGGVSPVAEEVLQRAASILTPDLSVKFLVELPALPAAKQELRAQWQAVGLLLARMLRSAPSLQTPAARELLESLQLLGLGLYPTHSTPKAPLNLMFLQEAAPLLARLAQLPDEGVPCKQLESLALVFWRGARTALLLYPGPLRSQFRGDTHIRNAMLLAVLSFLHSTAQTAAEELPPLLVGSQEAAASGAGTEVPTDHAARAAPSTFDTALESIRLLYSLFQGEGESCQEYREAYTQTFKFLYISETQLRPLELITKTSSARLVAAEEHLGSWMDRLVGISELLLSMAAAADAADVLSGTVLLMLQGLVENLQMIMRHIQAMSGAPGASANAPDASRRLRGRCLGAARALLKLPGAMLSLQQGLPGAHAAWSALDSTGRDAKLLREWEQMRQELHPALSAEVVVFAASIYFTLWDTTGLNELESAEMRRAHARMKALGGEATDHTGWVETCLGFEMLPHDQRSLEDRFAQREEELPADAAVRLHRKLVARQQQQAQKAQKQQAQLSEAELKAKEAAARAAAEALLREEEEAEARRQQQSTEKAAKNKAKRERQKQQRKQEQQAAEQAAEQAKQAAEQAKQTAEQAKQTAEQAAEQAAKQEQQAVQPVQPQSPAQAKRLHHSSQPVHMPVQAQRAKQAKQNGPKNEGNSLPAQPAASPPRAAAQPSAAERPLLDASSVANGATPAAVILPGEQHTPTLGMEETDEDAEFLMMLAQLGVQEPSLENLSAEPLLSPAQQRQQQPPQLAQQPRPAPQQAAVGPAAGLMAATSAAPAAQWHSGGPGAAPVDDEHECVVCMSFPRQAVLVPCGHVVLCTACAQHLFEWHKGKGDALPQCPFCRAQVVHYVSLKH